MVVANFLRSLADMIEVAQNSSDLRSKKCSDKTKMMVPPLQQEIELMKKMANVDSVFEESEEEIEDSYDEEEITVGANFEENEDDELEIIKKNAGLGLGLMKTIKGIRKNKKGK